MFEAATTIDLIDIVMNEVNTHPDQPHLIHLTSPAYTITQARSIGNIGETGMPVLGTLIIVGDNGLDENGNSLTPDQITAWNVIERSSAAPNIDLFHIAEGGSLTLYNIRLVNGGGSTRFSGGAIVNDGELYLYNSQVVTNNSNYYGGGIHNAGTLVAINTEFTSNAAVDTVNLSGGAGSAIVNYGSLSAYCSTFKNNRVNPTITGGSSYVPFTIPGGAIYNQSSNINVHYSNFIGNTADGQNPNCPRWPQYGFCPLHIRDFASTVAVDASNNYWSQLDTTATWGSVTTSPTVPEVHYGDYSGEGDVCFVPPPPTAPLEITMSADDTTPRLDATVEFTITVSNPGQSELENVAVENEIPSELVYVQDDGEDATTYDADTNMIEWVFNLPAGESSELHIQMTLATATQSLQPTINMASPSIAALSVVVPENIDLAGSIITNTSTVKTIGGHDIDRLEAKLEIIPVACEGSIGSLITSAEMHSAPSIDPATLIATLEAPEEIGIIGYTLAPTGAPNCAGTPHCRWYRVARDAEAVEEGQERVGWIPADFIDLSSSCTDKVFPFDHESRIALLPTSSPECLAFITDVSRDNHGKIYTIEQIRDITNTDAAYDTYTLPAYSPVVITAIHPNRRYVRVVYRNVNGDPVRGDSWVEVREKDDDSYQDLTIISLGAGDTCVDEEGDFARDSIEALVVDPDNPDNGPNISLPSCDSTYLVNCVPDTTCHHIFGCDTTDHPRNTALVLNAFQDESDGGRGPTYCPLWDGVSGAENFHCGIDLVTEAYAVRNHTNEIGTEVFTVHGGLIYQYYSSTGSYKIRDREHYQQYIREYQYTHLDLRSELGNGTFANFVGEYLAAGIQIGTYSATTGTGSADIHVHYVEKVFLAPDHTWQTIDLEDSEDVILLDDDALQPLADNISPETYNPTYSAYQVPANFAAGTDNNPPARYIPLCKPNETENGGIVTRRIDNSGILTGVWRIEEGNISCQVARASRKCGRNDQIVFTLKETDTYDYPQGVFISENITSDQNRLDGTIENDLDNPVPHLFSIRIEAVDQACVPQRDGAIEFNWQIVP